MKSDIKDFIGIYEDVYPEGYCSFLIEEFERLTKLSVGSDRIHSEGALRHMKDDYQICMESILSFDNHRLRPFEFLHNKELKTHNVEEIFFQGLQNCYDHYTSVFSTLKSSGNIKASIMKMQKTASGSGGYHIWHFEQGSGVSASRVLVYSLYCNSLDKEDGGETEFLYQKLRYVPKENSMIIWPASYTHPHRGNPILTEKSKYIITGWFNYD